MVVSNRRYRTRICFSERPPESRRDIFERSDDRGDDAIRGVEFARFGKHRFRRRSRYRKKLIPIDTRAFINGPVHRAGHPSYGRPLRN